MDLYESIKKGIAQLKHPIRFLVDKSSYHKQSLHEICLQRDEAIKKAEKLTIQNKGLEQKIELITKEIEELRSKVEGYEATNNALAKRSAELQVLTEYLKRGIREQYKRTSRVILQNLKDKLVLALDDTGTIIGATHEFYRLTGYNARSIKGKKLDQLQTIEDPDLIEKAINFARSLPNSPINKNKRPPILSIKTPRKRFRKEKIYLEIVSTYKIPTEYPRPPNEKPMQIITLKKAPWLSEAIKQVLEQKVQMAKQLLSKHEEERGISPESPP